MGWVIWFGVFYGFPRPWQGKGWQGRDDWARLFRVGTSFFCHGLLGRRCFGAPRFSWVVHGNCDLPRRFLPIITTAGSYDWWNPLMVLPIPCLPLPRIGSGLVVVPLASGAHRPPLSNLMAVSRKTPRLMPWGCLEVRAPNGRTRPARRAQIQLIQLPARG